MLSSALETCLNQAFRQARSARQELLGVDRLLLALLDDPTVSEILTGCGADLRSLRADLKQHLKANALPRVVGEDRPVQPEHGFQRVLQRAVFHVQHKGQTEVGVTEVLTAIFTEKHSHAALLLQRMRITRLIVVNYLAGLKPPWADSGVP